MIILNDVMVFPGELRGGVLCVGNFDGVHRGHAQMLATGRAEAVRRGVSFTIMTFEPHPGVVLRPGVVRRPLTTVGQRVELLRGFGPEVLVVVPTTKEFLSMSAEGFLEGVVVGAVGAKVMVEGPTFNFGKGALGRVEMLRERGPGLGFETVIVPTVEEVLSDMTVVKVSSSLIRWLIEQGRVGDAGRCLGRGYAVEGVVVEGEKRGRTIGYPTANLKVGDGSGGGQLVPLAGVYAGRAKVEGKSYVAAISVGDNPTFGGKAVTVEAYLLDFAGDLYGKEMELEFVRWVREMVAFGGVEGLVRQIERDVAWTRRTVGRGSAED